MALPKLFQRIFWHNNTTPAINEDNLNAMSKAIDDIDNRVIVLGDDVITVIPQIQAYLEQAEDLVEAMELLSQNPPYIGQNGNWWVWDTNTSAFMDSGVDASISVNIADITMLAPDAAPYVTNTGTATDPIFHLFIPRGQTGNGISTIAKTGTSGLVDTYTITMTDGTTSTFTVTNGAGDMNKSVYDPTNAIANAGGMKSAAAKDSTNAVTANSTDLVESGAVYSADKGIYEVMGQNGAKNKLVNNLASGIAYGATLTVNEDKSFSFVGTTTSSSSLNICGENNGTKDCLNLPPGEYILASDSTGLNANTFIQILGKDGNGNVTINAIVNNNGVKSTSFTVNEGDYIYWCRLAFPSGTVNASVKAMICPKSWFNTDPTFQPYAETNQQLTPKTDGLWNNMMDNGSVNEFSFDLNAIKALNTSGTWNDNVFTYNNGVTFTVNSDHTITVNGTSSGYAGLRIDFSGNGKKYRLSGCPNGGSRTKFDLTVYNRTVSAEIANDYGQSVDFVATSANTLSMYINIRNGQTLNNAVFKPMLSDPALNLSYDDYVPYAMTNRELTDDLANMGLVRATPNKTTFNITYQGGKSGDMAFVITSVGLGTLNFYASAWHWGAFVIASGTTITASNDSANGLTLTSSGNIGLFILPLNTEGDKWAIITN